MMHLGGHICLSSVSKSMLVSPRVNSTSPVSGKSAVETKKNGVGDQRTGFGAISTVCAMTSSSLPIAYDPRPFLSVRELSGFPGRGCRCVEKKVVDEKVVVVDKGPSQVLN
ncbi:uncharacterized protein SPSK_09738 [Sporothrix schenckii 1099-18]|uniref:Uncharacterized protein n=1 Tax=Sporothrix schenckii 1099-18 TaxID=1397361 RepID=A0A0F2M820_SPOSC|nr:uncharacterized protein SPSK_09738 [Sporothrix schenckii 1099-18]KJR84326.1 hypothetical protein SPSK_09738 [Sporothrix schenckii 1099-18]